MGKSARNHGTRAIVAVVACVMLAMIFLLRAPLERALACAVLDVLTNSSVSMRELRIGSQGASIKALRVERWGKPLLLAEHVGLRYELSELGKRSFGLTSFELDRPELHVIRFQEGGFNIPLAAPQAPGSSRASGIPLRCSGRIHEGVLVLSDPSRRFPASREQRIDRIDADVSLDSAALTHYNASGALEDGGSKALRLTGTIDRKRGVAMHRFTAPLLPLPAGLNDLINTDAFVVLSGEARNVDVRAYAFPNAAGEENAYHISGGGELSDGILHVIGFHGAFRSIHGRFDLFDDGVAFHNITGTLVGAPLHAAGAIYNFSDPALRLFVRGAGGLEKLRAAFDFSKQYPLRGQSDVSTLVEGRVKDVLALVRFSAASAGYDRFPIDRARGLVAYYGRGVDVVGATGSYGNIGVVTSGHVELGNKNPVRFALQMKAHASELPFTAQIAPSANLDGSAILSGPVSALEARGIVNGRGGGDALLALAHIDARGEGAFDPLLSTRADGSVLTGGFYLDRPHASSAFWLGAHDYHTKESANAPILPGFPSTFLPNATARIDGIAGGGESNGSLFVGGKARVRDLSMGRFRMDEAVADFAGSLADLRLGHVRARGAWGSFSGSGGYGDGRLALDGTYRGDLERLRAFTGDMGAEGSLSGTLRVASYAGASLIQVPDAHVLHATIHGVPVDGGAGTVEIRDHLVRLAAADVAVAGGKVIAAGELGGKKRIGLSAIGLDARSLGTPLEAGTIGIVGSVEYANEPRFEGGVFVDRASYNGRSLNANGDVDLTASRVRLHRVEASVGATYGAIDGELAGLGTLDPSYDVSVAVHEADLGALGLSNKRYLDGTIDADVHVGGHGAAPNVQGLFRVPEGMINGLRFFDGTAEVTMRPAFADIRRGSVKVGSTSLRFSGGESNDDIWMRFAAPQADLSDFNDLFTEGNTLAGKGNIAFDVEKKNDGKRLPTVIRTAADIDIADLRYKGFALGNALAHWNTTGSSIAGKVAFGGASGRLRISGRVVPTYDRNARALLKHSWYDLSMGLQGLDLGVWLPTLGYHTPLSGSVDADAHVYGRYPALGVTGALSMTGGTVGKYPIERFTLALSSSLKRTTITDAMLQVPSLSLEGHGSFGLGENDPLLFNAHASSSNIGTFFTRAIARGRTLSGTLEADVRVAGTRKHPRVDGNVDVERMSLRGVQIPRVVGSGSLESRTVTVRDMQITFPSGSLEVGGAVPFTLSPFGVGPSAVPLALDLAARNVDLSVFRPLLPLGSDIAGTVDGDLAVMGTAGDPRVDGKLALSGGLLATPFEKVPLRNLTADLIFGKSDIHVRKLHADMGGGTLDARGVMRVADLTQLRSDVGYGLKIAANHARVDFPTYGAGTVDGTLRFHHDPKEIPVLSGSVTLSDASIPFSALYHPDSVVEPPPLPLNVALDINAKAGRNVHVRSENMDIGASGAVKVGGSLSNLVLDGAFDSSGGTLTYFNRIFRVIGGTVTFEPDMGIVPLLNAQATTHVFDPGSLSGFADVTLTMNGPVTNLSLGLDSDPSYDREQILALLLSAPQIGALLGSGGNGVAFRPTATGGQLVGEEAFDVVNARFTQTLLAPLESAFGQALGLSNLNVDVDYTGGVNVTARKLLGKRVNAVYASGVSYPYRQSFGFELKPNDHTSAQVTFYQTLGQPGVGVVNGANLNATVNRLLLAQPLSGTNGFSFSFLRYWP